MSKTVLAYHFTDGWQLRDGQPLVVGSEYVFDGTPMMCECGYHASRHVFDAMMNAPGPILSRVECREITDECDDKLVCRRRRVIATIDATKIAQKFARMCALDVIHLWDAPDVVVRYLKTGDESIRGAAWSAAWAARDAAWDAARIAAWAAASAIARDVAWDTRDAAMSAAMSAARSAANAAAWDVAWDTRDASRAAAWDAANAAAWGVAWDTRDAASAIARDTALRRQRVRLARMVNQAFKKGEES